MTSPRATKKQQELLQFIDGFISGHGYGPSYREVMRALGYKSVSTVATHIEQLIAKGYLEKKDNSARSLTVATLRPAVIDASDERLQTIAYMKKQLSSLENDNEIDAAHLEAVIDLLSRDK